MRNFIISCGYKYTGEVVLQGELERLAYDKKFCSFYIHNIEKFLLFSKIFQVIVFSIEILPTRHLERSVTESI